MKYILYFASRARFADRSTWSKEKLPQDATIDEVRHAARIAGCEGFAIVSFVKQKTYHMEWFVK